MKTYYELLEVPPDAPTARIRQAFRQMIARCHPDKVQHLGAEFQELAQVKSAELTTAYKTLIDPARRAEYDQTLWGEGGPVSRPVDRPSPAPSSSPFFGGPDADSERSDASFQAVRSGRDALLRRAALAHVDRLFGQAFTASERVAAPGFDLSCLCRPRLFERSRSRPWLLAKFVSRLDGRTVREVWAHAVRANAAQKANVSVFVLAGEVAPQTELAEAIASNRQLADSGRRITIIPIDVRDWRAFVPGDADPAVRSLAARLRERTPS